jgi:midasin (ATPase involved in ribosome maturation)
MTFRVCVQDVVRLSKWDEQSYYSLRESAERSHRGLLKLVQAYKEALDTPVRPTLLAHVDRPGN